MHWWVREAFRTNIVRCDAGTDVSINVTQFRTISLTYNYIYIYICIYCVDFYPATHPKSPSACGNIAKLEWPKVPRPSFRNVGVAAKATKAMSLFRNWCACLVKSYKVVPHS